MPGTLWSRTAPGPPGHLPSGPSAPIPPSLASPGALCPPRSSGPSRAGHGARGLADTVGQARATRLTVPQRLEARPGDTTWWGRTDMPGNDAPDTASRTPGGHTRSTPLHTRTDACTQTCMHTHAHHAHTPHCIKCNHITHLRLCCAEFRRFCCNYMPEARLTPGSLVRCLLLSLVTRWPAGSRLILFLRNKYSGWEVRGKVLCIFNLNMCFQTASLKSSYNSHLPR